MRTLSGEVIATVLTGVAVLVGTWRLVDVKIEALRRDLAAQIAAVNTRIDNIFAAKPVPRLRVWPQPSPPQELAP